MQPHRLPTQATHLKNTAMVQRLGDTLPTAALLACCACTYWELWFSLLTAPQS